ncbi:MAG TPA: sigma-70 family RNA polymerase sigma factor [Longilinea sp.]|nr:sigma-70 family RNA polymerase sigma factor [Longilinea sp.]
MDEKQAIAQLKRHNPDGLENLVYQYQVQAVRTACLIVGDRAQAEDIVQAAFIRAGERIDQFDDQRPFGPWFMRSVARDALKALERQKRFTSLEAGEETGTLDLFDPAPLPEEAVETGEIRQAVWQALESLSPKQRAAVVMRYYLEMHEDEIAEALHGAKGSVKWWLFMARQHLKNLLAPSHAAGENPRRRSNLDSPESGE